MSFTTWPLYSGERALGTHWIWGWVGPKTGYNDEENRKILPYRISNLDPSVVQPVTGRYTDWATPAPWLLEKVGKTQLHVVTFQKNSMNRPHARTVPVSNPRPTTDVIGRFMHRVSSQLFSSVNRTSASQLSNKVETLQRSVSQTPCGTRQSAVPGVAEFSGNETVIFWVLTRVDLWVDFGGYSASILCV
jgi:hypothetical protein